MKTLNAALLGTASAKKKRGKMFRPLSEVTSWQSTNGHHPAVVTMEQGGETTRALVLSIGRKWVKVILATDYTKIIKMRKSALREMTPVEGETRKHAVQGEFLPWAQELGATRKVVDKILDLIEPPNHPKPSMRFTVGNEFQESDVEVVARLTFNNAIFYAA